MFFKRAISQDINELNTLLRAAKMDLSWYKKQPSSELERYMSEHEFTVDNIKQNLVFSGIVDNRIIAVFSFTLNKSEAPTLDKFYLLPKYKGKGYGSQMWRETILCAQENFWPSFTIISTEDAELFYKNRGAVEIGRTKITENRSLCTLKYDLKDTVSAEMDIKH